MTQDDGISHGIQTTRSIAMIMSAFAAVALYNVVELAFIIPSTFKRWKGLYFWSFVVATSGILPYTLGFMFKFFDVLSPYMISITMIAVGWCCMVTGQSVVLYSRLHLVVREPKTLRCVLIMIIVNAVICHGPIIVLVYGANSSNPGPFTNPYSIYEKVQITIFFLQESIISGIYVFSTVNLLKPAGNIKGKGIRSAMNYLIYINVLIIIFDLSLLTTEYVGQYEIQVLYKAALYSVKLKLEFRILNQLVEITQASSQQEASKDGIFSTRASTLNMDTLSSNRESIYAKSHIPSSNYIAHVSSTVGTRQEDFIGILKEEVMVVDRVEKPPSSDYESDECARSHRTDCNAV